MRLSYECYIAVYQIDEIVRFIVENLLHYARIGAATTITMI